MFFLIAFVFLIFSKLSNDYKQTIKLRINLVNIQDEIILHDDSVRTIDAYIEAKGFALIPFIFKSTANIEVDAKTDVISKSNTFIFDVQKHLFLIEEQLSKSYNVISILPDTIVLPFSKRASKFVPIALKSDINFAVGYDIKGDYGFDVDSVKVVGSDLEVNKVTILTTKNLVLNDVKSNINENVEIDLSNFDNIEVFPKSVTVSGEVTRFTEGTIEIPIHITNTPSDTIINYFPKTVKLVYYVDLDNYNSVKATDFEVECNYLDVKNNQTYFTPKIVKKPNFVKRISIKQKQIDFIKL
jgi:hypothetical protein